MREHEGATERVAKKVEFEVPEMPGLISKQVGGAVHLLCVSDKHKLAELHPGNILKIKDRRCKVEVVFDLSPLLTDGGR